MLFNSLHFAIFLPIIFTLYWIWGDKLKFQNILLLIASYFFYAAWDWRFLFLLIFSTLLDYYTGIKIFQNKNNPSRKQKWFLLSILINLGFLAMFKYYNFFAESFSDFIAYFGFQVNPWTLQVILPVGISFYTFHGLSYVIDLYKDKITAEKNFINYALFVSFFPLLVAGPIERATHLLPQIKKKRVFDYSLAADGLRQILWGLFKKVVIADQCASYVNFVFNNPEAQSGSTLLLGVFFFSFQIYGDFSGYSDIALGTAKLFGIQLLRNFSYPYFSRDIAEFWRRWHISLSSWFKDYVYIPLGGNRGSSWKKVRNTMVIFLVSGFWHGANWTFIAWGMYHTLLYLPLLLTNNTRNHSETIASKRIWPTLNEFINIITTFWLVTLGWIFFRAKDIAQSLKYFKGIFSESLFLSPTLEGMNGLLICLTILILVEWIQRNRPHGLYISFVDQIWVRWSVYFSVMALIFLFGGQSDTFIYFQF